jgi:ABC-type molybdenum transport system ATPase subunit/photorepair protein PhrA
MIPKRFSEIMAKLPDLAFMNAELPDGKLVFGQMRFTDNQSPLVIIYGDNASGKSLIASAFEVSLRKPKEATPIEVRNACMRNRTASGMERAFIYGDESDQSTGQTSIAVVRKAINSTDGKRPGVVILDEPDVGLADRFQPALARYIVDTLKSFEGSDRGMIVISHNKILIGDIIGGYDKPISFIGVGTEQNYWDWVDAQRPATIGELFALSDKSHEQWRAISKAFDAGRER